MKDSQNEDDPPDDDGKLVYNALDLNNLETDEKLHLEELDAVIKSET